MDAANRIGRWLLAAGLVVAAGCHAGDAPTLARGQIPPDPISPISPVGPPGRVVPGAPVAGSPVSPDVQKTGYSPAPAAKAPDLLRDAVPQIKVVALVGATNSVTDQEVIEAVRQRYGELAALDAHARKAKEKELYSAELRRIVERELVLDEMYTKLKKAGKMSKVDEIKEFAGKAAEASLRNIRKQFGNPPEEEFLGIMRSQGLSLPVIRRQIERQFMADEYVRSVMQDKGRSPGLADLRDYYDRHPNEFRSEDRVKWLDIFVSFNKHATPRAAYDHAEAVRRAAAGGADFVELVKKYDNGLAVGSNGVGVGSKRGEVRPVDVEPAVFALRPGEVSQLIETPAGYHIVKVAERDYAGPRPFDAKVQGEVREKLLKQTREAEYHRLVEDLWRKGGVRVIENP